MTPEPLRTVPAVLKRLTTTFSEFTTGFNEGEYVLWLGSGISRARVPNVVELLERVLEHLRSNVTPHADCVYRAALEEVLRLAALTSDEWVELDFTVPVSEWSLRMRILTALATNYSKVLNVVVGDEHPDDYLVWIGLDAPNTYGAPHLLADVEHYCIALLMLEGVVTSAVTANWDGLLEKALSELTPAFDSLVRVVVKPADFRNSGPQLEVLKFHGCAVRARENESEYRHLLIAREDQISGWTEQPENKSMRKHLEVLYTDHLTLMIGLSAQDANLHTVFAGAIQDLARPWPSSPPAVVFSEEHLEAHHRNVLKLTYGDSHHGNSTAIAQSALLGSYGKPTLLALVLSSLTEKLRFLAETALASEWDSAEVKQVQADLIGLRDFAAGYADPNSRRNLTESEIADHQRDFVKRLIRTIDMNLDVFRNGPVPSTTRLRYQPLSRERVAHAVHNPDFPAAAFGLLGVTLALVGRGRSLGHWRVAPGDRPEDGVVRLTTQQREARVYAAKDATTMTKLGLAGWVDEDDVTALAVVAEAEPRATKRSPHGSYGRDGKARAGRFNLETAVAETNSAEELYEAFKLAGGF